MFLVRLGGSLSANENTKRTPVNHLSRWALVLPVAALMTTTALAGCKRKEDEAEAQATTRSPLHLPVL